MAPLFGIPLQFKDFLYLSAYAHCGEPYPPAKGKGREGNYNYTIALRFIMGHTVFGKSQGILPNLVRETLEKSWSFIIENNWPPFMQNDNDRALVLKICVNCRVKHIIYICFFAAHKFFNPLSANPTK